MKNILLLVTNFIDNFHHVIIYFYFFGTGYSISQNYSKVLFRSVSQKVGNLHVKNYRRNLWNIFSELLNTVHQELFTNFKPRFAIYPNLSDNHFPSFLTMDSFPYAMLLVILSKATMKIAFMKSSIWIKTRSKIFTLKVSGN